MGWLILLDFGLSFANSTMNNYLYTQRGQTRSQGELAKQQDSGKIQEACQDSPCRWYVQDDQPFVI